MRETLIRLIQISPTPKRTNMDHVNSEWLNKLIAFCLPQHLDKNLARYPPRNVCLPSNNELVLGVSWTRIIWEQIERNERFCLFASRDPLVCFATLCGWQSVTHGSFTSKLFFSVSRAKHYFLITVARCSLLLISQQRDYAAQSLAFSLWPSRYGSSADAQCVMYLCTYV